MQCLIALCWLSCRIILNGDKLSLICEQIQYEKEPQMQVYWAWHQPIFCWCTNLESKEKCQKVSNEKQLGHFSNWVKSRKKCSSMRRKKCKQDPRVRFDFPLLQTPTFPILSALHMLTFGLDNSDFIFTEISEQSFPGLIWLHRYVTNHKYGLETNHLGFKSNSSNIRLLIVCLLLNHFLQEAVWNKSFHLFLQTSETPSLLLLLPTDVEQRRCSVKKTWFLTSYVCAFTESLSPFTISQCHWYIGCIGFCSWVQFLHL